MVIGNMTNNLSKIQSLLSNARAVMLGVLPPNTAWEWLDFLAEEMGSSENADGADLSADFRTAVVDHVDWSQVDKMNELLEAIKKILPVGNGGKGANLSESEKHLWADLDGDPAQGAAFFGRVSALPDDQKAVVISSLIEFNAWYVNFKRQFTIVAALLLYYAPVNVPVSYNDFKVLLNKLASAPAPASEWAALFRYLGQAVAGRDSEPRYWAIRTLGTKGALPWPPNDWPVEDWLLLTELHLAFLDFVNLDDEQQQNLIWYCTWRALLAEVPVKKILTDVLAAEINVNYFISWSGLMAQSIENDPEAILTLGGRDLKVNQLIADFFSPLGNKIPVMADYEKHADKILADAKLPAPQNAAYRRALVELMDLYQKLRDCELVDYHGIVAEEHGQSKVNDWKKIIAAPISATDLQKYREYLQLLHRPVRAKMELVGAFLSVPWDSDQYLPQVLALSDLYEQIYGPGVFAPLVYFDEHAGDWKLNKILPETP